LAENDIDLDAPIEGEVAIRVSGPVDPKPADRQAFPPVSTPIEKDQTG
jgi:hypothetical protein